MNAQAVGGVKATKVILTITKADTGKVFTVRIRRHTNPVINAWYRVSDSVHNFIARNF